MIVYVPSPSWRVFHRLLGGVNGVQAAVMVMLILRSAALAFLSQVYQVAAPSFARGGDFMGVFEKPQRDALATPS